MLPASLTKAGDVSTLLQTITLLRRNQPFKLQNQILPLRRWNLVRKAVGLLKAKYEEELAKTCREGAARAHASPLLL